MSDDKEQPGSEAGEPKPPKTKAEDKYWYLLATLYGVPVVLSDKTVLVYEDAELRKKNQRTWNRYFAAKLHEETRARLIAEKRYPEEELAPFSSKELLAVQEAFAKRKGSTQALGPPVGFPFIDFSNVQFDQFVDFDGYILSSCSFEGAIFSREAYFRGATFSGDWVSFRRATFAAEATFLNAVFDGEVHFDGATFCGLAFFGSATFSKRATFSGATFSMLTMFNCATSLKISPPRSKSWPPGKLSSARSSSSSLALAFAIASA